MDANLSPTGGEGYDLTKRIKTEHPDVAVLSISSNTLMGDQLGIPTLEGSGMDANELAEAIKPL